MKNKYLLKITIDKQKLDQYRTNSHTAKLLRELADKIDAGETDVRHANMKISLP